MNNIKGRGKDSFFLLAILVFLAVAVVSHVFFLLFEVGSYKILYFGIAFGVLVVGILFVLLKSRQSAINDVEVISGDLRDFKLAVENTNAQIIITDAEAKITFANEAASETTGYTVEEMLGKTPRLWGGQMDPEFYQQMWHTIKVEKKSFRGIVNNKKKNGDLYVAQVMISPILGISGELKGFVGLEEDISDRKTTEDKLVEQTRKLAEENNKDELILNSMSEGVIVLDQNGKIILANPEAGKILGWNIAEMLEKQYTQVWDEKDNLGNLVADRPIQKVLSHGETVSSGEFYYINKNSELIPVNFTITPWIHDGKIVGAIDVFRNITKEKAIDVSKSEFVSLASHQLRTPLSAINWYVEILLSGDLGIIDPAQRKYLQEIYGASRRMVDLVNSLLNVSRIDLGTFVVEPEELRLDDIAREVVGELKPQIVYKKLEFTETYDEKIPVLNADPKLMKVVIQNLLGNAIKYTSEFGKIMMELKLVNTGDTMDGRKSIFDGVMVRISDTGYGIPEESKEKIFRKLFRTDNAKTKEPEGSGLGLYVVKKIIDAVGGQIWFESTENVGTSFFVIIPLTDMSKKVG